MKTLTLLVITAFCMEATPAWAHAFGQRYDLPVPLRLYLIGAGAAVGLSFVLMAFFFRHSPRLFGYPRFNLLRLRAEKVLANPCVLFGIRSLAAAIFFFLLAAGFFGNQSPIKNITPTMVWVIWWVGMAYVCALVGDVWTLVNPWRNLFTWGTSIYRRIFHREMRTFDCPYPRWLGYWPGFALFLVFAWLKLVWEGGEIPRNISVLAAIYSAITWSGMLIFGKEQWLHHGEAFSVAFGLLARFAPSEVCVTNRAVCESCRSGDCRKDEDDCVNCHECMELAGWEDREWNLRPYAVGLLSRHPVPFSLAAFVLLILSTVTFDGFIETPAWAAFLEWLGSTPSSRSILLTLQSMGIDLLFAVKSTALAGFVALFLGVFFIFNWLMAVVASGSLSLRKNAVSPSRLACFFAFSLVPIAIAYHLAHYLSYLAIAGQLVIPLASDPFGFGWDLFGTAHYRIRLEVMNARMVWFIAVVAILVGHIVAVYLAHVEAFRAFPSAQMALRSQYPMIILMIGYTVLSLWILAQPIVESGSIG